MMSLETFCVLRVRKTVVPSTRGMSSLFNTDKNCSPGSAESASVALMASTPVRHVTMMENRIAAKDNGSQPHSAIFQRFATKKHKSTTRKKPATAHAAGG